MFVPESHTAKNHCVWGLQSPKFSYVRYARVVVNYMSIGVLLGCFGGKIDGPGLPGGLVFYQGHLFALNGHLCTCQCFCSFVAGRFPKQAVKK